MFESTVLSAKRKDRLRVPVEKLASERRRDVHVKMTDSKTSYEKI